jgi:hypothetical protein
MKKERQDQVFFDPERVTLAAGRMARVAAKFISMKGGPNVEV